jgi:Holliday junction resolvase RusA-like endonuclease
MPSAKAEKALDWMTDEMRDVWVAAKLDTIPMPVMVNASIVTYAQTKRRADASNLYQLPEDAMERAGVIENDYQIASHDGSRRLYDRENPRVEITLSPARIVAWSPMPPPKDGKKREM